MDDGSVSAAAVTAGMLKARAAHMTGLNDFGDPWFERPLAAWAEDLGGPLLSEPARGFLARQVVDNLCRRLEVQDCLKRNPEIDQVELPPILYITGLERSGTTWLHNLLARHPLARSLCRWELAFPTPPPEAETFFSDPRIALVQSAADRYRGTLLEQMHWVNAVDPEDCIRGAVDATGLMGRAVAPLMPNWRRFLAEADLTPSFLEHRRLLKLLLWKAPPPRAGHLALRSPHNSRNLFQLAAALPEARFAVIHRDPFRAATSLCTLVAHTTEALAGSPDFWRDNGPAVETVVEQVELGLTRLTAFADAPTAPLTHVAYPDLIRNPAATVEEIYRRLEIAAPVDLADRVAAAQVGRPRSPAATPPAKIPDYGLKPAAFLARPAVAAYCDRFGISPEKVRLTGA